MTHSASPVAPPRGEASTADLVKLASTQLSALIRDEVALAKAEMTAKARNAGMGAGMFGAAGILAAYGLGGLFVCIGLLLALVMPGWVAALIVTVFLFVLAGVLALAGRSRIKRATPPMPADAIEGIRTDVSEISEALRHGPSRLAERAHPDGGGRR